MSQIERKIEGKEITEGPAEEQQAQVIDLMQALKASLSTKSSDRKPAKRAATPDLSPNRPVSDTFTRIGKILIKAGRRVIEKSQAATIPVAVMLPRCQNGGVSVKLSPRNPTTVVRLVTAIGAKSRRSRSKVLCAIDVRPLRMLTCPTTGGYSRPPVATHRMQLCYLLGHDL